jgi:PPM family protein phosphatase
MALRIVEEAGVSDVGRQRSTNEDALLVSPPLYAVADGMGGARAGEVASQIAVEMLQQLDLDAAAPEQRLAETARAANRRIYDLAQQDESRSGMGTTMTALVVSGNEIAVGHVGDSRLYRYRDETLERLTRDHSLVEELVRRGELQPDQVESHPQRAIITRALGPAADVEVETFTLPARAGDAYLLCSDGLTTMLGDDEIGEILRTRASLQDAGERLVNAANENGGRDNVTAVLVGLGEDGADDEVDRTQTRTQMRVDDVRAAAAAPTVERASPASAPSRRSRLRTGVTVFLVLVSIALLLAGFWFGSRQFYYLDSNAQGAITLYRGVPLELPIVSLSEPVRVSSVAADDLPPRQRAAVLEGGLRTQGDATDLLESLEQQAADAEPEPGDGGQDAGGDRAGGNQQQGNQQRDGGDRSGGGSQRSKPGGGQQGRRGGGR